MTVHTPMPAPTHRYEDAEYHRTRAMRERALADAATDVAARQVHTELAALHDDARDAGRTA